MQFTITHQDTKTNARVGRLVIGDKKIETPILFHGTILGGRPEPWKYFTEKKKKENIRAIMINAFEIIKSEKKSAIFDKGIHNYLGFNGIICMDSGGFLIQKKKDFNINIDDVIEIYRKTSPDLIVALDYPLNPSDTEQEINIKWKKTLHNFEEMSKIFPNIMPVIHGYKKDHLEQACDVLSSYDTKLLGVGSLVPLIKSVKGTAKIGYQNGFSNISSYNARHFVIDAVKYIREKFPERFLHVFGIGSASTMHLMFSLGVDSIDSMGWRLKAAYGAVQLPFTADRFLSDLEGKRKKRPIFNEKEKEIFNSCNCGIHSDFTYEEIDRKFEPKAIHNAFVFLQENLQAIEEIKRRHYFDFVMKRLEKTVYLSLFKYAMKKDIHKNKRITSYL